MVTFQGEAEDRIRSLSALLIALEKETDLGELKRLVETIYRKMHALKGAASSAPTPWVVMFNYRSYISGWQMADEIRIMSPDFSEL